MSQRNKKKCSISSDGKFGSVEKDCPGCDICKKGKIDKALKKAPKIPAAGLEVNPSPDWNKRVLFFTPSRGLVRTEWVDARYAQIHPCNWSMVSMKQSIHPYLPIQYQLADAQNLMAKVVVENDFEWIIYVEDDNIIPPDLLIKFNQYMLDGRIPVVSGIYFTKSDPPEPLLYRGMGNSYYQDWKMGDMVWVDGIPFGCRLEHAGLIKEAWKNSPEYRVGDVTTRRVFEQPNRLQFNEERGGYEGMTGTTDLEWCKRIIREKLFDKIGYPEIQKLEFPFLVDTTIFVKHIDQNGRQFPLQIPKRFLKD